MSSVRKQYSKWLIRNVRAQYKIPKDVVTISEVKAWMKKMNASDYNIRRMEAAMRYVQA